MKLLFNNNKCKEKSICSIKLHHPNWSLLGIFLISNTLFAQKTPNDSTKIQKVDEVLITAIRAKEKDAVTFTNVAKKEIQQRNLGQDIPILLNFLPSVVTTSDAGNGFGYTGIRVRGSDASRVNVTINGIPYNDAESQGTFWVNMPDFASSVQSIQLQRGVGTSTNGAGAFGASLNLATDGISQKSSGEINNSFGSFNSRKHTVKFSSGLINNHLEISGRLSVMHSDGYIDRAFSDLKSYFLQAIFLKNNTLIKGLVFGGTQKSYQAWNGIDGLTLLNDRTYNPSGVYLDQNGVAKFYENETDNYNQDHYQLHWNERWSNYWSSNLAFHYTIGKGYYENYKVDDDLADYNLLPQNINGQLIETSDVIRQKWLDNDFYGTTYSINYKKEAIDFIVGGSFNRYDGDHIGNVLWAKSVILPSPNHEYYFENSKKRDFNIYTKLNYDFASKLNLYVDLQYRNLNFKTEGIDTGLVDDSFAFFNPKAGLTYNLNDRNNFYFSFAKAQREPNRNDYEMGNPKPEKLDDYEMGWRYSSAIARLNINGYFMKYKNQLVLTGALNDVGYPVRENSGDSYRLGVELESAIALSKKVTWQFNATISSNKNVDFVFQKDGELVNLGNTNIAFSPNFIGSNGILYQPIKNLNIHLLTKFVGEQFMGNIDSKLSKLKSYTTNDLNISYTLVPKSVFEEIGINLLINNIFDYKYESNGYYYTFDDDWSNPNTITTMEGVGYFPQAGINFLVGLNLKF